MSHIVDEIKKTLPEFIKDLELLEEFGVIRYKDEKDNYKLLARICMCEPVIKQYVFQKLQKLINLPTNQETIVIPDWPSMASSSQRGIKVLDTWVS